MNDSKDIPKIKTITLNNKTYRNRDDSCVVVNDSVYCSNDKHFESFGIGFMICFVIMFVILYFISER
nr:MAG TPA: Ellis van Creveld protein 2 like protein [Caudoviricetes sp.]